MQDSYYNNFLHNNYKYIKRNKNSWELIIDYLWENQHQVELTFNTGVNSDEMNLLNITSTPCLNHDSISKYLFYSQN